MTRKLLVKIDLIQRKRLHFSHIIDISASIFAAIQTLNRLISYNLIGCDSANLQDTFSQFSSDSNMKRSNSESLILVLASNSFFASAPTRYLHSGFLVFTILRTISATDLADEPFLINAFDFSIILFVIPAKG